MNEVVDHGLITEEDFRDYTFTNAAMLYAGMTPDFFKGTACESAVRKLLPNASRHAEQAISA